MKTIDWTRDELVAYILLFAAHSDFKEDNPFILSLKKQLDGGKNLTLKQQQAAKKVFDNDSEEEEIENKERSLKSLFRIRFLSLFSVLREII